MENIKTIGINEILDNHIPKLTKMVADGYAEAFLVCGGPGIGKTYGIEKCLKEYQKKDPSFMWTNVGGDISKIGLYKALFEYNRGVIVFDDVDSILSRTCANLLKNALNSKEDRIVSYRKNNRELFNAEGMTEEEKWKRYIDSDRMEFPNSFKFTGRCIFISNEPVEKVDGAVSDRCVKCLSLNFDTEQLTERIIYLMDDLNPRKGNLTRNDKYEVLQYVYDAFKRNGRYLSLREFVNALTLRASFPENDEWKDMFDL